MNIAIQNRSYNFLPVCSKDNSVQNKSQTIKNQNKIDNSRYDVSIYNNKGLNLPFGKGIAVYAGSFDPITKGHLDIIKTGASIFDKVIVLVAKNPNKAGFIPVEKRVELIEKTVKQLDNVQADSYNGLLVDYAKSQDANFLIRGLRTVSDFDAEMQISEINKKLNPRIKTVFLNSSSQFSAISSSAVREILTTGGNPSRFVPPPVARYLEKYPKGK